MVGFNGNMSMRLGEDLLLVTGTTVPKGHLTDNDVVLICVDGTRIAGPAISSETAMHTDVYKAVPDARLILHTHPTHLLALSVAVGPQEMLSMPLFESRMWKEKLAFADACAPGSRELARSVGEAAVKGQAVFMKEHGLCVYGKRPVRCWPFPRKWIISPPCSSSRQDAEDSFYTGCPCFIFSPAPRRKCVRPCRRSRKGWHWRRACLPWSGGSRYHPG